MKLPAKLERALGRHPAFRQAVWRACAEIPRGETRTYGWIARRIGRPGSARAVGSALAANPFAPDIPCHRVIRADGALGGYSGAGGTRAKARLLAGERARLPSRGDLL